MGIEFSLWSTTGYSQGLDPHEVGSESLVGTPARAKFPSHAREDISVFFSVH